MAVADEAGGEVELPCRMVLRSIGYKSVVLPGLPANARRSVLAHEKGRLVQDGKPVSE